MNESLKYLFILILLIHLSVYFWAFVEKRIKPKLAQFQLIEEDRMKLFAAAMEYHTRGFTIPSQILEEPKSKIIAEAKRLEMRLFFEAVLVSIAGSIPAIALIY